MITTVYFDLETGGVLDSQPDIQLSAVAIGSEWQELESFSMLIEFDEALADPEALKLNHYDRELWKRSAHPIGEVVAEFARFLDRYKSLEMVSKRTGQPYNVARLAGFNAATFDGPRLRRMFGQRFFPAHPLPLCVMQMALWHFHVRAEKPENYKPATLCKHFGIPLDEAHEALADCRATVQLARVMALAGVAA